MPESSHPPTPIPLTPSSVRAVTAAMVRAAVPDLPPHTASTAVDALDNLVRALLVTTLDLTPLDARSVMTYMWQQR